MEPIENPNYEQFYRAVRQVASNWFAGRGYAVHAQYAHILAATSDWPRNIILPEVVEAITHEITDANAGLRCPFALNGQINNGLSSQAMLFNLVGPLIVRHDLEPLRVAYTTVGIPFPQAATAAFEIEDRTVFEEQVGQPTSIDMVIKGTGSPLFVEAKFTEKTFGGCSVYASGRCDCNGSNPTEDLSRCYLQQNNYLYWQRLREYGFLDTSVTQTLNCILANDYQFFREVLFALYNDGFFVLLHDERNPHFISGRRSALLRLIPLVPAQIRNRIKHISIQQIFAAIVASGRHADWVGEFAQKYGLGELSA